MPGLPTNTSAMRALAVLGQAGQNLTQAANQVPAGLANSTAADNPAYWPAAPKMTDTPGSRGGVNGAPTVDLTMQRTYFSNPSDSLTTGVDSLVAANMNEATTKLAALQVSQQLGSQALSISHSKARLILKLFEL